jgi:hypothetical protein
MMLMKSILACILLFGLSATSVSAQTLVRLEVDSDSWLSPTPFDVGAEVTKRLREANIAVTDAPAAPLVHVSYVERPMQASKPGLPEATLINFRLNVRLDGATHVEEIGVRAKTENDGTEFPSADELRLRAIQMLIETQRFALVGHQVGAVLGIEASFRALLVGEPASQPRWSLYQMVLNSLTWSSDVDDLCELSLVAVRGMRYRGARYESDRAERFLKKNLSILQSATSNTMRAPLVAIDELAEYGDRSSSQVLNDLMANPHLAAPAYSALQRIEARANGIAP